MSVSAIAAFSFLWSIAIAAVISPYAPAPLILTEYILKNETELARNLSKVDPRLFLNVNSYSGFLTVDEKYNSNMFYWFFPVVEKPLNTTPWIIWLQGGPGVTSLAGLFVEMGPLMYGKDGLKLRESSWTKEFSMVFIDNPVGAGFSFAEDPGGMVQNMDECGNHLYKAVQQFLEIYPELRAAPLFVAGESYAGHYVPALAHKILHPPRLDLRLRDTSINMQGLMMGNPIIDRKDEVNLTSVYYQRGLIDPQGVLAVKPLQEQYAKAVQEGDYDKATQSREKLLDGIEFRAFQRQSYNVLKDVIDVSAFETFVSSDAVREAIHVGGTTFDFSSGPVSSKLKKDFLVSMTPQVEELLEHYRVLIYCGQLDLTAPCVMNAEARRRHWRWSGRGDFLKAPRNPWWRNDTVAGYVKSGGNFTEVLVRDAGHLVPMDKPFEARDLISAFIRNQELPLPPEYQTFPNPELNFDNDTGSTMDSHISNTTATSNGLVASIVLNCLFAAIIVLGVVYAIRWKRRHDNFFYTMTDSSSLSEGVLTMD